MRYQNSNSRNGHQGDKLYDQDVLALTPLPRNLLFLKFLSPQAKAKVENVRIKESSAVLGSPNEAVTAAPLSQVSFKASVGMSSVVDHSVKLSVTESVALNGMAVVLVSFMSDKMMDEVSSA